MLLTLETTHRQVGLRGFAASYEGMIQFRSFIRFFSVLITRLHIEIHIHSNVSNSGLWWRFDIRERKST